MTTRFLRLFTAVALAMALSLSAAGQEYSNGGKRAKGRGPATSTPVEAFGVHPPGLASADARHWKPYIPYYAPLSPVASSTRWKPWSYHFLLPYYTPYYQGYSPHRPFNPPPRPYGSNGWGNGPRPEMPIPEEPGTTPLHYAGYTSVIDDDTVYWNMGGNGLVPYGEPPPVTPGSADLVDAIQADRAHRGRHRHFHKTFVTNPSAITAPPEMAEEQKDATSDDHDGTSHRRGRSAEPIPPGSILPPSQLD